MKQGNQKGAPKGGSPVLTYILIAMVAVLFAYYVIVPLFTPPSSTTSGSLTTSTGSTISINTAAAAVSMSTSTDIGGSSVTISGKSLPADQNITVKFGTEVVNTVGTCQTTSSGSLAGCSFAVPKLGPGSYTIAVIAGATTVTAKFTIPQFAPPVSTVLVTMTSVGLGLVTQLVTRRVVDLGAERRMRAEVNSFNKQKREATVAGDKAKLEKLKKRELQMRQEQAKVSTARFKVTAITFIPLLVVYYLMADFLGGFSVVVAYSPILIPYVVGSLQGVAYGFMSLFWWYFLSSFTFSTLLSKALHTTP